MNVPPQTPVAPVLKNIIPGKNKLALTWSEAADATSYKVFYATGDETPLEVDVGNVTKYTLGGLSNDLVYTVWLKAVNQLTYYFQVASYIGDPDDEEFAESFFVKEDYTLDIGDAILSEISNKISIQPEAIVAYPNLPDEGCFIATAAFGYYSAEQVQVLRNFRDHYLLTNEAGSAFVNWYYHYGPSAAAVINEYPLLKPLTRALLYPLIIATELLEKSLTGFFLFAGFCLLLFITAINVIFYQFRKRVRFV